MLRGRLPTPNEARMLDSLLVILVEHGMVSHVIAARLIYHCAPEAMQAAVAAALCGAGSVHLGSSEWSAKMMVDALPNDVQNPDIAAIAASIYDDYTKRKQYMPGIGHRTHAEGDPRADTLFGIAKETGVYGKYCDLLQAWSTSPAPSAPSPSTWVTRGRSPKPLRSSAVLSAPSAISPKRSKIRWRRRLTPRSSRRWCTNR
jgi:citrate synthase